MATIECTMAEPSKDVVEPMIVQTSVAGFHAATRPGKAFAEAKLPTASCSGAGPDPSGSHIVLLKVGPTGELELGIHSPGSQCPWHCVLTSAAQSAVTTRRGFATCLKGMPDPNTRPRSCANVRRYLTAGVASSLTSPNASSRAPTSPARHAALRALTPTSPQSTRRCSALKSASASCPQGEAVHTTNSKFHGSSLLLSGRSANGNQIGSKAFTASFGTVWICDSTASRSSRKPATARTCHRMVRISQSQPTMSVCFFSMRGTG